MVKNNRGNMPSKVKVLKYWSDNEKFESEGIEINSSGADCFACGNHLGVQRAHILPLNEGGDNSLSNLHLLCSGCHTESEFMSGKEYWVWLINKNIHDYVTSLERVAKKIEVNPEYYIKSLKFLLGCEDTLKKYNLTKGRVEEMIAEKERLVEIDGRS